MHYQRKNGSLLIEVILAGSILAIVILTVVGSLVYSETSAELSGSYNRATFLAEEGLEAARNIRDANFVSLTNGAHGLATSSNAWAFSGTQDTTGEFTRTINIGTVNANTKRVTSTVSWQTSPQKSGSVVLTTELTNWRALGEHGGMLVYGDGALATDTISYKILSSSTGLWSGPAQAADVDAGTTNKALRAIVLYSSSARNEKVMISRHFNGTTQFIYGQVWNGTTTSWGNVQLLSSWTASTFLDIQNFSGTYLVNGNFMVVYSDNTTIPKMRFWNGTSWQTQASLANLGSGRIPTYIVAKARPGTNEVMGAFYTQASDAVTEYYDGTTWSGSVAHATNAPSNTKRLIDFDWSPNSPTVGMLVFSNGNSDRQLHLRMWTANGAGGGTWTPPIATANQGSAGTRLGAVAVRGRPGANEFIACDDNTVPQVICYQSDFTPTFTNPTNQIIAATTDAGIQRTFDIGFEAMGGNTALGVYSDATAVPKLKAYAASTLTWDISATNINALSSALESVRMIPSPISDDIMVLLADTTQNLYSVDWDGTNGALYTTPSGKAFASHGTKGSADEEYWFDFAWDNF